MEEVRNKTTCVFCNEVIWYSEEDCEWDDKGMDHSAKTLKCPMCGHHIILKYQNLETLEYESSYKDFRWPVWPEDC